MNVMMMILDSDARDVKLNSLFPVELINSDEKCVCSCWFFLHSNAKTDLLY